MTYDRQLPTKQQLEQLGDAAEFPSSVSGLREIAERESFPVTVTDFLGLFMFDETFVSRKDFRDRCEELEMLIEEERKAPKEKPRNPLD